MRLICPACGASYDVPDAMVAPARKVRCAKCHEAWVPVPVEPEPALFPDAADDFVERFDGEQPMGRPPPPFEEAAPSALHATAERLAPVPAPSSKAGVALVLAWVGSFALLGGMGYGAVTYREDIVKRWPPSERAYAMLGLSHR